MRPMMALRLLITFKPDLLMLDCLWPAEFHGYCGQDDVQRNPINSIGRHHGDGHRIVEQLGQR